MVDKYIDLKPILKVSIITVVYNNVDTITGTIESVLSQDYPDIEYIVIDGESDDGTLDILNTYKSEIATLISEPDHGIYDAMNKGLSKATGDVIGFLNADDLLDSDDCISALVQIFKETSADVVYGDNLYVNREDPSRVVRTWKPGDFKREKFEKGWMPPHMATYFRKELFHNYGNYDTNFEIVADYEMMFRFLYVNRAEAIYIPKVISRMRVGGVSNNSLSVVFQSSLEVYKSWKKHGEYVTPIIMIRKPLSKIPQYFASFFNY